MQRRCQEVASGQDLGSSFDTDQDRPGLCTKPDPMVVYRLRLALDKDLPETLEGFPQARPDGGL